MTNPNELLRVSEAARIASVTPTRIYQAIALRELCPHQVLGMTAIDEGELRRWMVRPKRKTGRKAK